MKKIALTFLLAAGMAAAADSWRVNISAPTWVGTNELKPGDYKVSMDGDKATFKQGKQTVVEVPAKVQEGEKKNSDTSLSVTSASGKRSLVEIRLGGSKSKIVIGNGTPASE